MAPEEGRADALLHDGRRTYLPTTYLSDFHLPDGLDAFTVLVEVPSSPPADEKAIGPVLREDPTDTAFGLPADLNGDGSIDSLPREADYAALPVSIWFRWVRPGDPPNQTRVALWLRGDR